MHLVIESVGTRNRGGSTVLNQLLDACVSHPGVSQTTVFCDSAWQTIPRHNVRYKPVAADSAWQKLDWAMDGWKRARQASGADIALSFNGFSQAPDQFVMVHNTLIFDTISGTPLPLRMRLKALRELTVEAMKNANGILVQTQTMAAAIAQETGLVSHVFLPTRPQPFSGAPSLFQEPKTDNRKPSNKNLLWVGSEFRHKDVDTLFAALRLLDFDYEAVLVGNGIPMEVPAGVKAKWAGDLGWQDLGAYYRDADLLINTSLSESLCLPLLEALATPLPIVTPDLPYSHEVCRDAAVYFQPANPVSLAKHIDRALRRGDLQELAAKRHNQIANNAYQRMVSHLTTPSP